MCFFLHFWILGTSQREMFLLNPMWFCGLWSRASSCLRKVEAVRAVEDVKVEEAGTFLETGHIRGAWSGSDTALGCGSMAPFHAGLRLRWFTEAWDRALNATLFGLWKTSRWLSAEWKACYHPPEMDHMVLDQVISMPAINADTHTFSQMFPATHHPPIQPKGGELVATPTQQRKHNLRLNFPFFGQMGAESQS